MAFETQKVAKWYFVSAVFLFALQVIAGLVTATQYIWPRLFWGYFNFNIAREWHLNLMIFWLVIGFMGICYYIWPEELGTELYSQKLAYIQLLLLLATGVAVLIGFLFNISEGREYIEAPRYADWLIVLGAVVFAGNMLATLKKRTKPITATIGVILCGVVGLAVVYLAGMKFFKNLVYDQYFWWWVIHFWVEGAWELIAAGILAFLLIKLTGVNRALIEKWLYIEIALVLITGIIGIGHHYYWIGTPKYWLWWGGVFSALEPLPILLMVVDTFRDLRLREKQGINKVVEIWTIGGVVTHFLGAGVWGFAITLPAINRWTHGTQLTAAHGHFAFFGAYAMLIIAFMYMALPEITGKTINIKRGIWAFWVVTISMVGMVIALTIAGAIQTYLWRMQGTDFMVVREQYLGPYMISRLVFGWTFAAGTTLMVWDLLRLSISDKVGAATNPKIHLN